MKYFQNFNLNLIKNKKLNCLKYHPVVTITIIFIITFAIIERGVTEIEFSEMTPELSLNFLVISFVLVFFLIMSIWEIIENLPWKRISVLSNFFKSKLFVHIILLFVAYGFFSYLYYNIFSNSDSFLRNLLKDMIVSFVVSCYLIWIYHAFFFMESLNKENKKILFESINKPLFAIVFWGLPSLAISIFAVFDFNFLNSTVFFQSFNVHQQMVLENHIYRRDIVILGGTVLIIITTLGWILRKQLDLSGYQEQSQKN